MSYANYLYIAIRAAVDAGKSIMDIYNEPRIRLRDREKSRQLAVDKGG